MATILVFKAEGRLADNEPGPSAQSHGPRTAEIVIFPGVRYERAVGNEAPSSSSAQPNGRSRDRLDLIE
jgi:hypothetical protein